MKDIIVGDILEIIDGKLTCGDKEETLENFKKDTNEIEKRRYICRS